MHVLCAVVLAAPFTLAALALPAAPLAPIHARCTISPSEEPGQISLRVYQANQDDAKDCDEDERHCSSSFSHDPFPRLTGVLRADLSREGATLTAALNAEAGNFACSGVVHQGVLKGNATFTPSQAFVDRMEQMGFTGYTSEKLEAYAFLDVESAWARSLKTAGVQGMNQDNLIAMRIFNVEPAYIASLTALGYPMPDADKLIALRVQKVDPEEVRQLRALGFHPSLDELVQCRIFHITPDFVRQMQSRGFKDLTVSKLVQIKIFKLDE